MTDSLDDGRVSFGNRDEIELATATDPVCGRELKRADAAGAIDVHGTVYFFHSIACRDAFAGRSRALHRRRPTAIIETADVAATKLSNPGRS